MIRGETWPDLTWCIYSGRYPTFLAWCLSYRVVQEYLIARDVFKRVACETVILGLVVALIFRTLCININGIYTHEVP